MIGKVCHNLHKFIQSSFRVNKLVYRYANKVAHLNVVDIRVILNNICKQVEIFSLRKKVQALHLRAAELIINISSLNLRCSLAAFAQIEPHILYLDGIAKSLNICFR